MVNSIGPKISSGATAPTGSTASSAKAIATDLTAAPSRGFAAVTPPAAESAWSKALWKLGFTEPPPGVHGALGTPKDKAALFDNPEGRFLKKSGDLTLNMIATYGAFGVVRKLKLVGHVAEALRLPLETPLQLAIVESALAAVLRRAGEGALRQQPIEQVLKSLPGEIALAEAGIVGPMFVAGIAKETSRYVHLAHGTKITAKASEWFDAFVGMPNGRRELTEAVARIPKAHQASLAARVLDQVRFAGDRVRAGLLSLKSTFVVRNAEKMAAKGDLTIESEDLLRRFVFLENRHHVADVQILTHRLGARAVSHDAKELVPVDVVERQLSKLDNVPPALWRWLRGAQQSGKRMVDVGKNNPFVATGMAQSGKGGRVAMELHRLAPHHARKLLGQGLNEEQAADIVNAMRMSRGYHLQPRSFGELRLEFDHWLAKAEITAADRALLDRALGLQEVLERHGIITSYFQTPAAVHRAVYMVTLALRGQGQH